MRIGVPKEIRVHEYRVGLTPSSVRELVHHGHEVFVQRDLAIAVGFSNESYKSSGAKLLETAQDVYATADMIVKVKEPQDAEYDLIRKNQIIFTYLHLAPDIKQTKALLSSGCIAFAYETVTDNFGGLPLLAPMSEVAGRMSIQAGAHALERAQGGRGVLLGGVPGVRPAKVVVIGGGVAGINAARMAMGLGARVTILDVNLSRLGQLDEQYGPGLSTIYSMVDTVEEHVLKADLVVGAVLLPGSRAPKLVSDDLVNRMQKGSVLVDIAIDQGGCFATSRPTTHASPTFIKHDVVHYCVTNMPGAVARTSTFALNNATLPFVLQLANKGYQEAAKENPHLMNGLNIFKGKIMYKAVADSLGMEYCAPTILFC